ncbi:enhanced adult sensory threshold isoform X2 [Megachile rotundata]
MASREKKPLAPYKAKQKVNNDCGLSPTEIKNKKGKSLSNLKQQQIARNILEAVATGSQLPSKLEGSLPHKKVLRNLKRKQKLRVAKANLIKSKAARKVTNRNLCRITSDIKKGVKTKRVKLSDISSVKALDINSKGLENHLDTESEHIGTEATNRSAKNNLRTKKTKFVPKTSSEVENEDIQDTDSVAGSSTKSSPKLNRKGKSSESPDSLSKSVKATKVSGLKKNNIKERGSCTKTIEGDIKYTKGRKSNGKDIDYTNTRTSLLDTKFSKSILDSKSSIDLTIAEVIASMLSDSEIDTQQGITEKVESKRRSKKMLVEENIITDIEIKKEPDSEDTKTTSDGENIETESFQGAIQSRKRLNTSVSQRSLRNGKLRQSDSGVSTDLELKKRKRLNSDDHAGLEVSADSITNGNADTESCFSEPGGNDSVIVITKDEPSSKQETQKNFEDSQTGSETENNNNSDRLERANEVGPMLRSKTKAKRTEVDIKSDNIKVEYTRIVPKVPDIQEELKKASNSDQVRKDSILAKFSDKSKSRRSSLNIDMKKTVNSFYGTEKSDGNPKSQIDQMIENIKLTIAKSIERKIFGPETSHRLNKNFEVPKIEEIIAPLSAESQKLGLEENTDEDKSTVSKNEIKSDSSENSVPKVADTAKEIEKLVMGDIKTAETQSQNVQEEEGDASQLVTENEGKMNGEESCIEEEAKDDKKPVTRKSPRITDKDECCKKKKSENCESEEKCKEVPSEEPKDENDVDIDVMEPQSSEICTNASEDEETLESIAKEVEKLVTKGQFESPEEDTLEQGSAEILEPSAECEDKQEVTDETNMKDEGVTDENVSEEKESVKEVPVKEVPVKDVPVEEVPVKDVPVKDSSPETVPKESPAFEDTRVSDTEAREKITDTPDEETKTWSSNSSEQDETVPKEEEKEQKVDDKKRVLRARDKSKKLEKGQLSCSREAIDKTPEEEEKPEESEMEVKTEPEASENTEENELERQARTRRSREFRKRREDQLVSSKNKRPKRDIRKSDQQKEETLLDNEVAKINENNLSKYENGTDCAKFRGFSEGVGASLEQREDKDSVRSKSENDLTISKEGSKASENRLSRNLSENRMIKQPENMLENDCKAKTLEILQKDSDETSTSGESSSSINLTPKILETPEDKAKKESILRLLGLESLEKAAERLNHQKLKKEQYTGTLKTVIQVQKEKEKDKRRSRSPLKMVLKQGRGDGEGDSPENFYTIQKKFGPSWGDSSSGANRKFSTNHRHSCDEDNEDTAPKDRQSLVIPEKSSSFSIHPGRLCADVCCYCFGKFGSLDTPMHLAQMKSDERRKKILNIERHLTKDSCLCDACYRHVDRKANTSPTNMQTKSQKHHRQLMVSKCSARECRDAARHHVKRRWLLKIKAGLQKQVDIDWESSQHTSMSFCVGHYSKIERFLTCALCKRRLARNHTHQLANAETDELNQLLGQQGIPVLLAAGTFVCKLCRYFTQLQLKYKDVENMNTNHRSFFKSYRKRILHYHDIEVLENEDDDCPQNQSKDKDKRKKAKCPPPVKSGISKSPDGTSNSVPEKSTPEPTNKNEGTISETDNENRTAKTASSNDETATTDIQFLGIESTVEKLKKRKLLDTHSYTSNAPCNISCDSPNEVVEILAMDKEVTLTRLPKRQRTSNDISPVVQRLGANPSISVRTLFPGEEEMNLHANIEFTNVREITPQGWEKCATMIQYDRDTKLLWQELQRPYGNQSSFLRHLILLEKYYRSGDLVLAPNASRNAINYSTSVQNRLISYEGPEKMDEPIMEPIATEYHNSRRLSGGYVLERDRLPVPSPNTANTNTATTKAPSTSTQSKGTSSHVVKLNSGVSIIKKPPPNLQRLNLPSTSSTANGKRKDGQKQPVSAGGKVFQLSEPDFKRLQNLKKQKQMLAEKHAMSGSAGSTSSPSIKSNAQYQKTQIAAQTQFQKHLKMQQEMLNRQSRGDFEPLICDIRSLANENSPTQNLLHNLNLPKSIQVTTKMSNHIPILPKIPKSLTVIPQTVTKPAEK